MRLIQLENGDWVNPETIRKIRAVEGWAGMSGVPMSPRAVVVFGLKDVAVFERESFEDACAARDRIAEAVNSAIKGIK